MRHSTSSSLTSHSSQHNELVEVRSQNEGLTSLADEAQSLKDEMEVLRHSLDKVSNLEGTKKLEEVKLLEEKNTMYMQSTVSLEEDLRKANTAKGQLETYKRQEVELQNRLSDESKKSDKMEFEYKRLKEKVDSLQKEKDHMGMERDSLKETIDELETENRLINQHVTEGQGQVEELQKDLQEQGLKADDSALQKKKNQEYMDKLRELNDELLNDELLKKIAYIDDMEPNYNANTQRVNELEEALKRKEDHESMNRLLKQREQLTQHKEKGIRKRERLAREELEREDEGTPPWRRETPHKAWEESADRAPMAEPLAGRGGPPSEKLPLMPLPQLWAAPTRPHALPTAPLVSEEDRTSCEVLCSPWLLPPAGANIDYQVAFSSPVATIGSNQH
ncbi:hypothetical protein CRUP_030335 [Coryphaenoides rupestris]|nr:hypothetical protein CRUP_030335 [Coryphaenoides rupestris]